MELYFQIHDVIEITGLGPANIRMKISYLLRNHKKRLGLKLHEARYAGTTVFTLNDIGKLLYSASQPRQRPPEGKSMFPDDIDYVDYLKNFHSEKYNKFIELKNSRKNIILVV